MLKKLTRIDFNAGSGNNQILKEICINVEDISYLESKSLRQEELALLESQRPDFKFVKEPTFIVFTEKSNLNSILVCEDINTIMSTTVSKNKKLLRG